VEADLFMARARRDVLGLRFIRDQLAAEPKTLRPICVTAVISATAHPHHPA
jgi:hypothetical protein